MWARLAPRRAARQRIATDGAEGSGTATMRTHACRRGWPAPRTSTRDKPTGSGCLTVRQDVTTPLTGA